MDFEISLSYKQYYIANKWLIGVKNKASIKILNK